MQCCQRKGKHLYLNVDESMNSLYSWGLYSIFKIFMKALSSHPSRKLFSFIKHAIKTFCQSLKKFTFTWGDKRFHCSSLDPKSSDLSLGRLISKTKSFNAHYYFCVAPTNHFVNRIEISWHSELTYRVFWSVLVVIC